MKKKILLVSILIFTLLLNSCGITSEEIDATIAQIDTSYQSGTYEQAQEDITSLEKAYGKMSEEQKTKFDTLKSSVEYAAKSAETIKYGLNNAQNFIDKKMYYEAQAEIDKLTVSYTLPPSEQKQLDEKKTAIDTGIKNWNITEAFQRVETAYNGGKYDTATSELSNIDVSVLSEEQNQTYQSWQTKIADAKAKANAEAERKRQEANGGLSSSAIASIKRNLGVPDSLSVTSKIGDKYYWDAGQVYLISVSFYHNGELIAGASVDANTLNMVRNILMYSSN